MSAAEPFEIRLGNSICVLESILKRKGTDGVLAVRDLSSSTSVKISIVNAVDGTVVVDEVAVTIVTAASGLVRYTFSASDFTEAGIYHYTWTEYISAAKASFPVRPHDGVIWVHSATQTARQAYAAAMAAS